MKPMRYNLLKNTRCVNLLAIIIISAGIVSAKSDLRQQPPTDIQKDLIWSTSYQESIEKAKENNQPILIKFEASWCVWCQKMETDVLSNLEVIKELEKFICIKIDVDKQSNVAKAYKIKSMPRVVVINTYDEIVGDWIGYHEVPALTKLLRDVDEYTHTPIGTTSIPTIEEDDDSFAETIDIPEINSLYTDELIGLLGHRNSGLCHRVIELLVGKGPKVLPQVALALESKYLGTRIAAWMVIQELKPDQYKFDPWASSAERTKAIKIIKDQMKTSENI